MKLQKTEQKRGCARSRALRRMNNATGHWMWGRPTCGQKQMKAEKSGVEGERWRGAHKTMEMKETGGGGQLVCERGGEQEADLEKMWLREGATETKAEWVTKIKRGGQRRRGVKSWMSLREGEEERQSYEREERESLFSSLINYTLWVWGKAWRFCLINILSLYKFLEIFIISLEALATWLRTSKLTTPQKVIDTVHFVAILKIADTNLLQ